MVSFWFQRPVFSPECGAWQYAQESGREPVTGDLLPGPRLCTPNASPTICACADTASQQNRKRGHQDSDSHFAAPATGLFMLAILKHLDPPIERIHNEHFVVMVDEQARRQLKLPCMRALGAKVVKQLALAIEDLHHAPQGIHNVEIAFRVDTHRLRPEHCPGGVADLSDGVLELPRAVKHLHPEVHGIHDQEVRSAQAQLSGQIEFAFAVPGFADRLQDVALHVEHKDLVAQVYRSRKCAVLSSLRQFQWVA